MQEGGAGNECASIVQGFIERLALQVKRDLEAGTPQLTLAKTVEAAISYAREHGACGRPSRQPYHAYLMSQFNALNRLILDKSMEALSAHLERLGDDVYSAFSILLTRYAMHEIRLIDYAASMLRSTLEQGVDALEAVISILEPLVFAAAARYLAAMYAISSLPSEEVLRLAASLERIIAAYMDEENQAFASLQLYFQGGGDGRAESQKESGR